MQIKNEDFVKVMLFAKDKLLANMRDGSIDRVGIIGTLQDLTLDDFLKGIGEKKERAARQANADDKGFSKLWAEYPASPNFTYRGMKFKGSRVLRSNYQVCENRYLRSLSEHQQLTGEMVINALRRQKRLAYEESFETGLNKLNHWNGFEVWLNQEKFMAFISDEQEEPQEEEASAGTGSNNTSNYA